LRVEAVLGCLQKFNGDACVQSVPWQLFKQKFEIFSVDCQVNLVSLTLGEVGEESKALRNFLCLLRAEGFCLGAICNQNCVRVAQVANLENVRRPPLSALDLLRFGLALNLGLKLLDFVLSLEFILVPNNNSHVAHLTIVLRLCEEFRPDI